jgi:hypothetical protein
VHCSLPIRPRACTSIATGSSRQAW